MFSLLGTCHIIHEGLVPLLRKYQVFSVNALLDHSPPQTLKYSVSKNNSQSPSLASLSLNYCYYHGLSQERKKKIFFHLFAPVACPIFLCVVYFFFLLFFLLPLRQSPIANFQPLKAPFVLLNDHASSLLTLYKQHYEMVLVADVM